MPSYFEDIEKVDDAVNAIQEDVTRTYFPSVPELQAHLPDIRDHKETYVPILMYYASDPFTRLGLSDAEDETYQETVKYCRKLMYGMISDKPEDEK